MFIYISFWNLIDCKHIIPANIGMPDVDWKCAAEFGVLPAHKPRLLSQSEFGKCKQHQIPFLQHPFGLLITHWVQFLTLQPGRKLEPLSLFRRIVEDLAERRHLFLVVPHLLYRTVLKQDCFDQAPAIRNRPD